MQTVLGGVTCVAVKSCVTAGAATANSGAVQWVVDTWNGSKWTMHALKALSSAAGAEVVDSSCVSLSQCMLAGMSWPANGIRPLLAAWNGKTVSVLKTPVPSGLSDILMFSVSCTSTSNCAAVGDGLTTTGNSSAGPTAFTENWNGKTWTPTKLTWPKGTVVSLLEDVSCTFSKTAGRHCVAVGAAGSQSSALPVALSWNGSKWSALHVPGPAKGNSTVLEGISCLSVADCAATGETGATNGATTSPVAGFWNGTVWKVTAA